MNGLVNVPFWDFEHFKNPSGDHISYIQSGDQDIVTCTNRYWREYCDSDDTQSISSGLNPKYENLSVQKKFVYELANFCTRMDQSGSLEEIGPKQFFFNVIHVILLEHWAAAARRQMVSMIPTTLAPSGSYMSSKVCWPGMVEVSWGAHGGAIWWVPSGWNFTMGILSTISRRFRTTTLGCSRFFSRSQMITRPMDLGIACQTKPLAERPPKFSVSTLWVSSFGRT